MNIYRLLYAFREITVASSNVLYRNVFVSVHCNEKLDSSFWDVVTIAFRRNIRVCELDSQVLMLCTIISITNVIHTQAKLAFTTKAEPNSLMMINVYDDTTVRAIVQAHVQTSVPTQNYLPILF